MPIRVVNKRAYKGEGEYIGRPSSLGNPYRLGDYSRSKAISKYDNWLDEQLVDSESDASKEFLRLVRISITEGRLYLVCYCAPKPCHGDVIERKILYFIHACKSCGMNLFGRISMDDWDTLVKKMKEAERRDKDLQKSVFVLGDDVDPDRILKVGSLLAKKAVTIVLSGAGSFEKRMAAVLTRKGCDVILWMCSGGVPKGLPKSVKVEILPYSKDQIDDVLVARTKKQIFVGSSKRITRSERFSKNCRPGKMVWIK